MAFIADKEELKPGLVIFRRADVAHRNWYCRVKLPRLDRYKTISLKTSDISLARERAFDHDADVRFRIKHDVPVFNRSFADVAEEFLKLQERRAATGQIGASRVANMRSVINNPLQTYVGTTQVHLIGQDKWRDYPTFRREKGKGRIREMVSESTIRWETAIFRAVMNFAADKRYIGEHQRFKEMPALKTMRRDAFTLEEYRALHTAGRAWVKRAKSERWKWYRTVTYNFVLILCNTGMRPPEARNLRWRDVSRTADREGRDIVVLNVRGKGKTRMLVAPASVGDYIDRVRKISKATQPDDHVFTNHDGERSITLYAKSIENLLREAELLTGPSGTPRTTYSFRHTYATFRLAEGVDVYFLADQMGTSVAMIEDHYGHVNTVKHADLVLKGMGGWDTNTPQAPLTEPQHKAKRASKERAQRHDQRRT